jgi:hypothetical protein
VRYFKSRKQAKSAHNEPFLFAEMNEAAQQYLYKDHFRNQLKARLLSEKVSTQVLREGTLENLGQREDTAREKALEKLQSQIVWNIATAAFYKSGGRPWKVSGIRDGVCYVGLVFKKDDRGTSPKWASCGAQMFLDTGDGLVFKGAEGNWFNADTKSFHLSYNAARDLISQAIAAYRQRRDDRQPPRELFIETVLADVLALTKLNYNSCQYADGAPITLKFADAVGEVLTAGPIPCGGAPLPFMYYI